MLPDIAKETLQMCLRFLRWGDYLGLSRQTQDVITKILVSRGRLDYGKRQSKAESTLTVRWLWRERRGPEPSKARNEALEREKGKFPIVS